MELLEAENLCQLKRRSGPKPLSVRAKFASTAWLDGDIVWREGRVVWRVDAREIEVGPRELESVSRALASLSRHPKTARRHCADFEAWHARRLAQTERARQLAMIRAPDLETLVSPSRRRNPAALERLADLLSVEASVAQPLLTSPARALSEAWPASESALRGVLSDENRPPQARALAALVIGAARPFEALPGQPFLRRAARYGARMGFPTAPQLAVLMLQAGASDAENSVARVEAALATPRAPFAFDGAQLLALHRAGKDAATVAALAEAALAIPDPFPALSFAPVAPKRLGIDAQRAISLAWNELRGASNLTIRDLLAHIAARGDIRDLESVAVLLHHLISAPLLALGALKIERHRALQGRELDVLAWRSSLETTVSLALKPLETAAQSPDIAVLGLLVEAIPLNSVCPHYESLSPALWAERWHSHARHPAPSTFAPLLRLARRCGVAAARQALRAECWRELARHTEIAPELLQLALELKAWAPALTDATLCRFCRLATHWKGVAGARAALLPVMAALHDADSAERALWLGEVIDGVDYSRRGACCELPALARFVPALRRIARAGGGDLGLWMLVETALELWKSAPAATGAVETRFNWLADEMSGQLGAAGEGAPGWGQLAKLVGFLSQLARDDEPRFRALMTASWRFAAYHPDFDLSGLKRGARLMRALPRLEAALADGFARCPARCFDLLEKLGPLDHFDSIRAPLETLRDTGGAMPNVDWPLPLDEGAMAWAKRLVRAKRELGEAETAPPGILKIADWPRKIELEIAALRGREILPAPLQKRLENLLSRLEDRDALRAAMERELIEALRNAACEAELRAAERAVEACYRARLEALGASPDGALDADWLNAALFSTGCDLNRKWLREIVRRECAGRRADAGDWRLAIEGNARWLHALAARGLDCAAWLAAAPKAFSLDGARVWLRLEDSPLHILQMGNYFDTCLGRGGINAHSSIANAVELNKRVVFARDARGRVVGRQLLALSGAGQLLGYRVYTTLDGKEAAPLRSAFGAYARDFAARCGVALGDEGEVERLFVSDWYDDGALAWRDLDPPPSQPKTVPSIRRTR